ncbi:MAG TPA: patatin-like phospholipase family protein [Gemmatimonadales bacterium]|jgi:NTE family protein|nr:patatin-like phospholipase family protein [Gemmatimonadales bacterium]
MPAKAGRSRKRRRIGLALAGGGPEGAVYEIGALRALDEALDGLDLHELDIYVGVSAGAFIAASLANDLTTTQMVRALVKHEPGEHPFVPQTFFTPNYREWARRSLMLPRLFADAMLEFRRAPEEQTLFESLTKLARALPVGLFDNEPIRRYLQRSFSIKGRHDDFRELRQRLIVVATDLESGRPILFGEPGWDHVPISTAVQASTAIPGFYPPVRIEGRNCVDGILLKTLHASVALKRGVDLLLCVNPLVPADLRDAVAAGQLKEGALLKKGLATVLSQTVRTLINSRLEVGMREYETRFPDSEVLLFQPDRNEFDLFFSNIFSFRSRRRVVELAYDATRRNLRARRKILAPMLASYGITLREDILDEPRDIWQSVGLDQFSERDPVTSMFSTALDRLEVAVTSEMPVASGGRGSGARG